MSMGLSGTALYEAKMARLKPKIRRENEAAALKAKKDRIEKKKLMRAEKGELLRQLRLRESKEESLRRRICSCGRIKYSDPYTPGCKECAKSRYGTMKTRTYRKRWEDRGGFYWENPDPDPPISDQIIAEMVRKSRPLNVG